MWDENFYRFAIIDHYGLTSSNKVDKLIAQKQAYVLKRNAIKIARTRITSATNADEMDVSSLK